MLTIDPMARPLRTPGLASLPRGGTFIPVLGVHYFHVKTADEGDLYVTEHGLPFLDHLQPENWYEYSYFKEHRRPLEGTGTVYHLPTRPLEGRRRPPRSIDLVVKWSRVGQDVPLKTYTLDKALDAEFNSPFEEFALVDELRNSTQGPKGLRILLQKPLAIYVPPEHMQLWQTGRSRARIRMKVARHTNVEIDILRSYILLYGWIRGMTAVDACRHECRDQRTMDADLKALTERVEEELAAKGFFVADHKPAHFIVRMDKGGMRIRRRHGKIAYAIVDYELLQRTPEYANVVKAAGRSRYLQLQATRFVAPPADAYPPHLRPACVAGVDYVYGHVESTNGNLYVVGKNPELFNYFLPERWRTKPVRLSRTHQTCYARTKDRIHLVWKVSRLGDLPPGDLADPSYRPLLVHGYNTPFEEFGLAMEMSRRGLRVVYPRAIYVTARGESRFGTLLDVRRYELYHGVLGPDGRPLLEMDVDYITVWGYWRGLEDTDAVEDKGLWTPIDALRAFQKKYITLAQLDDILDRHREAMLAAGFEDLNLKPDHVLLAYRPGGDFKRDPVGNIEPRHCNLELVRKVELPVASCQLPVASCQLPAAQAGDRQLATNPAAR